jgi:uncharacterized membrane protein YbhN (UPF0104 family)
VSDVPAAARRTVGRAGFRALLGAAAGLTVAALAIGYLGISRLGFFGELRNAHPWPLLFAAVGGFVLLGFQSLRWWMVMRPVLPGLGYTNAYRAMLVGFFFNTLIPLRGGDLLRVQYLGRRTGVSRAKLLGTEVVDFFSDKWGWVSAFAIVCGVSLLLPPHRGPPAWLLNALAGFAALIAGVGLLLMAMGSKRWRHDAQGRPIGPVWLTNLRDGFAASRWRRLLVVETVLAPLPWLCETVMITVSSGALDLHLSPMQAFAALTAWNMGTAIPSPGNAGTFEATGTIALGASGVAPDKALAFVFLYHLAQVLPGMMAAAGLLVAEGETLFGRRNVFKGLAEPSRTSLSS